MLLYDFVHNFMRLKFWVFHNLVQFTKVYLRYIFTSKESKHKCEIKIQITKSNCNKIVLAQNCEIVKCSSVKLFRYMVYTTITDVILCMKNLSPGRFVNRNDIVYSM